jgi:hypothetical protein
MSEGADWDAAGKGGTLLAEWWVRKRSEWDSSQEVPPKNEPERSCLLARRQNDAQAGICILQPHHTLCLR